MSCSLSNLPSDIIHRDGTVSDRLSHEELILQNLSDRRFDSDFLFGSQGREAAAVVLNSLDTRPGQPLDWRTLISLVQGPHAHVLVHLRGVHPGHGTLLHRAVDCRKPEYCALLLMRGANIRALDSLRATPLIRCASRMCDPLLDVQVATVLLRFGAQVDATDPMGRSALHHAAAVGNALLVELLAQHGANVNLIGGLHRSALHTAAMGGHLEAVGMLVRFGADVTISDELNGMTALDVAVKFRRWDVAAILRDAFACTRSTITPEPSSSTL